MHKTLIISYLSTVVSARASRSKSVRKTAAANLLKLCGEAHSFTVATLIQWRTETKTLMLVKFPNIKRQLKKLQFWVGLAIRIRIRYPPNFWSILESESGIRFNSWFGFLIGRLKLASWVFSFNSPKRLLLCIKSFKIWFDSRNNREHQEY